jgi:hypothetical protein
MIMKNKILKTKTMEKLIAICLVLLICGKISYAQPPAGCDTCIYKYEIDRHQTTLDTVVTVQSASTIEFAGCGAGTLIKKNITFIHGLGGSSNSWKKQTVWTEQNYQTAVTNVNYDAKLQHSFHYICDELIEEQIEEQIEDGSDDVTDKFPKRCELNDFAIAHSKGE